MSYLGDLRKIVGHRELLSVGATLAVFREGKILLQLRADTQNWGFPGGSMELGETVEEAGIRELAEETGMKAEKLTPVHIFSGKDFFCVYPNGDALWSVAILYVVEDAQGDPTISDNESLKLQFFSLDDLPDMEPRAKAMIGWIREHADEIIPEKCR